MSEAPMTACEWRLGQPGLDEMRIVERAYPGGIRYAVIWRSWVANRDREWEIEPQPSSRDDGFLARCRFEGWEEAALVAQVMVHDPDYVESQRILRQVVLG